MHLYFSPVKIDSKCQEYPISCQPLPFPRVYNRCCALNDLVEESIHECCQSHDDHGQDVDKPDKN